MKYWDIFGDSEWVKAQKKRVYEAYDKDREKLSFLLPIREEIENWMHPAGDAERELWKRCLESWGRYAQLRETGNGWVLTLPLVTLELPRGWGWREAYIWRIRDVQRYFLFSKVDLLAPVEIDEAAADVWDVYTHATSLGRTREREHGCGYVVTGGIPDCEISADGWSQYWREGWL